jgi:hypothetical protein
MIVTMPTGKTADVSQAAGPEHQWCEYLHLVLTGPYQLVGMTNRELPGRLFNVAALVTQFMFTPSPEAPGAIAFGGPHAVVPFNNLALVPEMEIQGLHAHVSIGGLPEDNRLRTALIQGYLNLVDPPKIMRPPPPELPKDLIVK